MESELEKYYNSTEQKKADIAIRNLLCIWAHSLRRSGLDDGLADNVRKKQAKENSFRDDLILCAAEQLKNGK